MAVDHPSAAKQEVEQLSLDALVRERPPGSESNLPLCGVKIDVEGNEERGGHIFFFFRRTETWVWVKVKPGRHRVSPCFH